MYRPTQSGVTTTPIKLEMLALKIAAGIFPLAIETMTTEEDTVDGKAARKKTPSQSSSNPLFINKGRNAKTMSGKNKKVVNWTTMCIFQLESPVFSFSTLSRKP
ncbi:hypothetical protein CFS9_37790 [Flavobacterium sp. CFS9]|uniref:Uncharacterized protein n=1 Tax=Flavobacterium sp. CFS9 TaxID=3143118 RepID=A0AAT9H6I1_9FLAO